MPFFYCCSELRCCQGMLQWVLILCAVHVPWSVRRQNKLLVYEYLDLSSQVTKLSPLQRPSIKCCLGEKVIVTKQINTSFCGKNAKLVNVKARIDRGFKHLIAVVRVCMRACVRACVQSPEYRILYFDSSKKMLPSLHNPLLQFWKSQRRAKQNKTEQFYIRFN